MTDIINYKSLKITNPSPTTDGGLLIHNNFVSIADSIQSISGNVFSNNQDTLVKIQILSGSVDTLNNEIYKINELESVVQNISSNINFSSSINSNTFITALNSNTPRTLAERFSDVINAKDYGVIGDGVTDDTTALTQIMSIGVGKTIIFPSGIFKTSQTIVVPQECILIGAGGLSDSNQNVGTIFSAAISGMLVMKVSSNAEIRDIKINGEGIAKWGIIVSPGNKQTLLNVGSHRCTEYGIYLDASQNGTLQNVYSARNGSAGIVFANGSRNITIINSNAPQVDSYDYSNTNSQNYTCLLFLFDTTNSSGFNTSTSITTLGNDEIRFFGGIYETFNAGYAVTSRYISGSATDVIMNNISFFGSELTANITFNFETNINVNYGKINLHSCQLIWKDQDTPMSIGTPKNGIILFDEACQFSGGNNLPEKGLTIQSNMIRNLSRISTREGLAAYYDLGNVYNISGGNITLNGNSYFGITPINIIGNPPLPHLWQGFSVRCICTHSTSGNLVSVYRSISGDPWRRLIGTFENPGVYIFNDFTQSTKENCAIEINPGGNTNLIFNLSQEAI